MRPKLYQTEEERKEAKNKQSRESHRRTMMGIKRNKKYLTEEERKEARNRQHREWRAKNKDRLAEYKRRYYERNREHFKQYQLNYKEKYGNNYKKEDKELNKLMHQKHVLREVMKKQPMNEAKKQSIRSTLPPAVREHIEAIERLKNRRG